MTSLKLAALVAPSAAASALSLSLPLALSGEGLPAGTASEDMGGGRRMPGRAPSLPLMTVRFTVP